MYCGNCGNKIEDNTMFCPECGHALNTKKQEGKSPRKKDIKKIVLVLGIVVVIAIGGIFLYQGLGGSYEDAIDSYVKKQQRNQSLIEEYGSDCKITYEILEESEMSARKIEKIKNGLYQENGIRMSSIGEIYEIEAVFTITGSRNEEAFESDFGVIEIDGEWHVVEYKDNGSEPELDRIREID